MPETDQEIQKKKDEKKERKRKEALALFAVCALLLGGIAGYSLGYHCGLFEGFQLCLKQFEIIKHVPELFP